MCTIQSSSIDALNTLKITQVQISFIFEHWIGLIFFWLEQISVNINSAISSIKINDKAIITNLYLCNTLPIAVIILVIWYFVLDIDHNTCAKFKPIVMQIAIFFLSSLSHLQFLSRECVCVYNI